MPDRTTLASMLDAFDAPDRPTAAPARSAVARSAVPVRDGAGRFSEKDLQAGILDLLADKRADRATRVLVDELPGLVASNLNIKEKLNTLLFLTRAIQNAGGSKYGVAKLRTKIKALSGFMKQHDLPAGGFIELGCGAHDPVGLSTYFYLNGLTPAYGVDLLPARAPYFSALSMYDILANVKMFPGRYVWRGAKPADLLARLRTIDVAAFEAGEFEAGLESIGGAVRFIADDFRSCDVTPGSIALLASFAVLEHVDDVDAIARRAFELLAPGGIAFHFVDLADHRSYRGDGAFGPLTFLTEAEAPANMNRLRAPEITRAALNAGFEVLEDKRVTAPLTDRIRAALQPRFAAMDDADVAVIKQHIVLRKPA